MLRLGCYLCVGRAGGSERDALRAEGVLTLPLPPPLGLDGAPRGSAERHFWPKMVPRGPQRAQDGHQDDPRYFKMARDSLRHTSKRPQDGPKTVSSALRSLQGRPQEAKMTPKPKENNSQPSCVLGPRFEFAAPRVSSFLLPPPYIPSSPLLFLILVILAHPSHGSRPTGGSTYDPSWGGARTAPPRSCREAPRV